MSHYLIAGKGTVGEAWGSALEDWGHQISYLDPPKDEMPDLQDGYPGQPLQGAFICVPTPTLVDYNSDESSQNLGHVTQALKLVSSWQLPWISIRSTVSPMAIDILKEITDTPLIAHPEFLRQHKAKAEAKCPKFIVLGNTDRTKPNHFNKVLDVYPEHVIKNARTIFTSFQEAFLYKYAASLLFGTKVVFANTIREMLEDLDVEPHHALQEALAVIDKKFAGRHMNPYQGDKPGYGGKCLPKDTKLWQGEGYPLIDVVVMINEFWREANNE